MVGEAGEQGMLKKYPLTPPALRHRSNVIPQVPYTHHIFKMLVP